MIKPTNSMLSAFNFLVLHLPLIVAFALGLSLPLSNKMMNIALVLALLCVVCKPDISALKSLIKQPLIWLPALMVGMLAISLLVVDHEYGPTMTGKYKKLLYILPLALFFLLRCELNRGFINGFLLANSAVLIISLSGGLFPFMAQWIDPNNPTVFKLHITQNFFMALAVVLWLERAYHHNGVWRFIFISLAVMACANIFLMVQGRTGYVALIAGVGVWVLLSLKTGYRIMAVSGVIVMIGILLLVPNRATRHLALGMQEIQRCLTQEQGSSYQSCSSSMGQRTAFVQKSLVLIDKAPWLGNGAGSFEYNNPETGYHVNNPHNQYLLESVQSGLVGLTAFLLWMISFARAAWRQQIRWRNLSLAILASYLMSHFFNSFLLDSAEGHLFVILTAILAAKNISRAKGLPD